MKNNEIIEKFYIDFNLALIGEIKYINEEHVIISDKKSIIMDILVLATGYYRNKKTIHCILRDGNVISFELQNEKWIKI